MKGARMMLARSAVVNLGTRRCLVRLLFGGSRYYYSLSAVAASAADASSCSTTNTNTTTITEADRERQREILLELRNEYFYKSRLWKFQETTHLILGFPARANFDERNVDAFLVVPSSDANNRKNLPNLQSRGLQQFIDYYKQQVSPADTDDDEEDDDDDKPPLEIKTANNGPTVTFAKDGVSWKTNNNDDDRSDVFLPVAPIVKALKRFEDDIIEVHDDFEEEVDFRALNRIYSVRKVQHDFLQQQKQVSAGGGSGVMEMMQKLQKEQQQTGGDGDSSGNKPGGGGGDLLDMILQKNMPSAEVERIKQAYGFTERDFGTFAESKLVPRNRPKGRLLGQNKAQK